MAGSTDSGAAYDDGGAVLSISQQNYIESQICSMISLNTNPFQYGQYAAHSSSEYALYLS